MSYLIRNSLLYGSCHELPFSSSCSFNHLSKFLWLRINRNIFQSPSTPVVRSQHELTLTRSVVLCSCQAGNTSYSLTVGQGQSLSHRVGEVQGLSHNVGQGKPLAVGQDQCLSPKFGQNRGLHTSAVQRFLNVRDPDHEKKEKELIVHHNQYFDEAARKERNKKAFQAALKLYIKRNEPYRRGHVEFIYAAIEHMKEFQVHRDLETYKRILDLFPKEKMIPRNVWQVEFMHYPKQQQCCIDVLDFMEGNGVIPDDEMGYQLISIFGKHAHAFRKYQRMMYWMPKFRNANPYFVPFELPNDDMELALMALKRMSVDLENVISTFQTEELEGVIDKTFIVSAQSPSQCQLLREHPRGDRAIFVEGGFTVWLRSKALKYFVLRGECTERYKKFHERKDSVEDINDDTFRWSLFDDDAPRAVSIPPSAHEQDDGTVFAMCITGTGSKDSLMSWIKMLEKSNPELSEIPVMFQLRSPGNELEEFREKQEENQVSNSTVGASF